VPNGLCTEVCEQHPGLPATAPLNAGVLLENTDRLQAFAKYSLRGGKQTAVVSLLLSDSVLRHLLFLVLSTVSAASSLFQQNTVRVCIVMACLRN